MMMRIRRLFQRNLPAKIFALLVAVVLWFFVMMVMRIAASVWMKRAQSLTVTGSW